MSLLLFWQAAGGPSPVTGTATFDQAPATWAASSGLRFIGVTAFTQSATWAGEASERFIAATAFDQAAAEWLAVALNVPPLPPLTFSAGFTQDPATFDGKAIHWIVVMVWDRIALAVGEV